MSLVPRGEEANRIAKMQQQVATDAQGRRRFHGAFTGGFSAGYYNTVGSEEGWAPRTFSSSRSHRAAPRAQRPEDFMDEEDDPLMGKKLSATEAFDTLGQRASQEAAAAARGAITRDASGREGGAAGLLMGEGQHLLKELVVPARESIGKHLLKCLGWKEGQGIGRKVRKSLLVDDEAASEHPSLPQDRAQQQAALESKKEAQTSSGGDGGKGGAGDGAMGGRKRNTFSVAPPNVELADWFREPRTDRRGLGYDPFVMAPEFRRRRLRERELRRAQRAGAAGAGQSLVVAAAESDPSAVLCMSDVLPRTDNGARDTGRGGGGGGGGIGLGALEDVEEEDHDIYAGEDPAEFSSTVVEGEDPEEVAAEDRRRERERRRRKRGGRGGPQGAALTDEEEEEEDAQRFADYGDGARGSDGESEEAAEERRRRRRARCMDGRRPLRGFELALESPSALDLATTVRTWAPLRVPKDADLTQRFSTVLSTEILEIPTDLVSASFARRRRRQGQAAGSCGDRAGAPEDSRPSPAAPAPPPGVGAGSRSRPPLGTPAAALPGIAKAMASRFTSAGLHSEQADETKPHGLSRPNRDASPGGGGGGGGGGRGGGGGGGESRVDGGRGGEAAGLAFTSATNTRSHGAKGVPEPSVTRVVYSWAPHRLLCKRFNVPPPPSATDAQSRNTQSNSSSRSSLPPSTSAPLAGESELFQSQIGRYLTFPGPSSSSSSSSSSCYPPHPPSSSSSPPSSTSSSSSTAGRKSRWGPSASSTEPQQRGDANKRAGTRELSDGPATERTYTSTARRDSSSNRESTKTQLSFPHTHAEGCASALELRQKEHDPLAQGSAAQAEEKNVLRDLAATVSSSPSSRAGPSSSHSRPPIDLFASIFEPSSDEASSESSAESDSEGSEDFDEPARASLEGQPRGETEKRKTIEAQTQGKKKNREKEEEEEEEEEEDGERREAEKAEKAEKKEEKEEEETLVEGPAVFAPPVVITTTTQEGGERGESSVRHVFKSVDPSRKKRLLRPGTSTAYLSVGGAPGRSRPRSIENNERECGRKGEPRPRSTEPSSASSTDDSDSDEDGKKYTNAKSNTASSPSAAVSQEVGGRIHNLLLQEQKRKKERRSTDRSGSRSRKKRSKSKKKNREREKEKDRSDRKHKKNAKKKKKHRKKKEE